jgi:FkbM family methyltransferase
MNTAKLSQEAQIENLFRETYEEIIQREGSSFDKLTAAFKNSFVLFGAGGLGKKTLAGLRKVDIKPLAYADNNPDLWGKAVDGITVLSPEEAAREYGQSANFIVTIWRAGGTHRLASAKQQLSNLGCMNVLSFAYLFWKYPEIFLPYYCLDLPHKIYQETNEIIKTFSLWSDDASRLEYLAQLRLRLFLDFDGLSSPVAHEQYFPDDLFSFTPDEVFVDCGAFDGDSLKSFIRRRGDNFKKYIALEPDPVNLKNLETDISSMRPSLKNKITIYPLAATDRRGKLRFDATGTAAATISEAGTIEINCAPLDEILANSHPTYIKMDIEGAEFDALLGAKQIIQKLKPVLAISVYHQQNHLWRIPMIVRSFCDQYSFFLRPHNEEAWDLILYAIPQNRLIKRIANERTF